MQRTVQTGSFQCTSARGAQYTVNILTHMFDDVVLAQQQFETVDGQRVRRISKGHYQVESVPHVSGMIQVTSDDPLAP